MELTLPLPEGAQRVDVTGPAERNLKIIREALSVRLAARESTLRLLGDPEPVRQAAAVLKRLTEAARHRKPLTREQLLDALAAVAHTPPPTPAADDTSRGDAASAASRSNGDPISSLNPNHLDVYLPGRSVRPVTPGQRAYLRSILEHDLTFCFGPAGTGKTYLAVAAAAALLKKGLARKLVLVRPAVEAGEKLGFLPGTMQDKVNPYLRPLLDALHDMMDYDQVQRFMAADLIEIVPLAFMRGRTLNDAVIILDEAQNTTKAQMLMFLTRLGHGSRMVVTGDTSQTDLPNPNDSGLVDAVRKLQRTPGIGRIVLSGDDIVRHSLVQRIVEAYGQPKAAPQHLPDDLAPNHDPV
ncbi:MAG: PhoH family protein [Planctomycetota bacterium]